MSRQFNPFQRSKMKIVEPLQLLKCEYDGWAKVYRLEYRASRGAANAGLLAKQFAKGKPLVANGNHVVVRDAQFTLTNSTVDEVTIRVEAVSFADVLAQVTNAPETKPSNCLLPVKKDVPFLKNTARRKILG